MTGAVCVECLWPAEDARAVHGVAWALCGPCRDRLERRYGVRYGAADQHHRPVSIADAARAAELLDPDELEAYRKS